MIILKVTKTQGFTLSLEDAFFEKPQGRRGDQTRLVVTKMRNCNQDSIFQDFPSFFDCIWFDCIILDM